MKNMQKLAFSISAMAGILACDGSTTNPATVDRADLQPPGNIYTVTGDGKIELRWSAANVEDDFRGYMVFGSTTGMNDLKDLTTYPADVDLASNSMNRCKASSALFEKFGLPETDVDCEGGETTAPDDTSDFAAGLQEGDETTPEASEKLENFLKCDGVDHASLSIPHIAEEATATTMQTCVVSKVWDGTEMADIKNGDKVTFVVFAVAEDDFSKVSWSSSIVEDSAAPEVAIDDVVFSKSSVSHTITFSDLNSAPTAEISASETVCGTETTNNKCRVSNVNAETAIANTIWIARDYRTGRDGSFAKRIFLSAPVDSNVAFRVRQVSCDRDKDPTCATVAHRTPGDMATLNYVTDGITMTLYGGEVIDMRFTVGSKKYYGKLIVDSITQAAGTEGQDDKELTVKLSAVIQPGEDVQYYLK